MLEGAKLIGAGAATIASAGAAVSSRNSFSSFSRHSVARNPSLCKKKELLRNDGICSNRSYCIICSNDGLFDLIRLKLNPPKNVLSMGKGKLLPLFYRGIRPAINVGLSVSRVGDRSVGFSSSSSSSIRDEFFRDFSKILVLSALAASQFEEPIFFSPNDLFELTKRIKSFSYHFCPFMLKEALDKTQKLILYIPARPDRPLFIDIVNRLDYLVIQTLASSLNALCIRQKLFGDNSFLTFGEKTDVEAFSRYLESWSNIDKILLLDFSRQVQKIGKEEVITKVSPLLEGCPEILYLLSSFLDQAILNEKGEPITEPPIPTPVLIPPMSDVLLNLNLIKVDRALANLDVRVARLGSEVVVGISKDSGISTEQMMSFIDRLNAPLYKTKVVGVGESAECAKCTDSGFNFKLDTDGNIKTGKKNCY